MEKSNIKFSKFFLLSEIFLNIIFSLIIISGFFLPHIPNGMLWNIPLLIFTTINSIIKILCFKINLSMKKRAKLHIPLLAYLLIIILLSIISKNVIIFKTIFFAIIFVLNIKFNYFVKFIHQKNNNY